MKTQTVYHLFLIVILVTLALMSMALGTASGSQAALVTSTPASEPEFITVFVDKDTLTVYVPGKLATLLKGVRFQYQISAATSRDFWFTNVVDFAPYMDTTFREPFCMRLERAGSEIPFPTVCKFANRPTQNVVDGDVFWWDEVSKTTRTLVVALAERRVGICDAGASRCDLLVRGPTPAPTATCTATPTDTPSPTSTNTPTLSVTPSPTPTLSVKKCYAWDILCILRGGQKPSPPPAPTPTATQTPITIATETATGSATPTPRPAPADTPTVTATPTQTPACAPDYSGRLAIPITLGYDPKVYVTEFDGVGLNGPRPISLDGRQPRFSRDGESLIINGQVDGVVGVFLTDSWGRQPELIIDTNSAWWADLSPEGSEVLYSEMALQGKLHRGKIGAPAFEVRASERPILVKNPLWTDDNQLVFHSCATWLDKPGDCGIWVTDADHIDPKRIVVGNHAWPTDARHGLLAFMSAEDGDWEVYVISLDGGQLRNITDNESQDGMAAIAPDGRSLAYISSESGSWALWTAPLDDPSAREKRFDIRPERGTVIIDRWHEDRISWTR